jgi:hypothetical protein
VFAGAGVSTPPPSNYPDFKELANQVAGGVLTPGPDEPIDRFLGRLADRGTKVHRMVGEILTNPDSKPNSLHFDLLRLFPSSDALRLVTTNFDPHFSTATSAIFPDGKPCEIHYAPALPLGDSFSGIVYLHGGVERPFERLVLTDSDFGRAYLTEGWARVFLQKLFERYTVLFVGYSHNDPVMNYLVRGLPPPAGTRKRFALTALGEEESCGSIDSSRPPRGKTGFAGPLISGISCEARSMKPGRLLGRVGLSRIGHSESWECRFRSIPRNSGRWSNGHCTWVRVSLRLSTPYGRVQSST